VRLSEPNVVYLLTRVGIRTVKKLPDFDWYNKVVGLTCLDDELFVLRNRYKDDDYSSDEEEDQNYHVEVYSTKSSANYTGLREFSANGRGTDIVSCERRRCLYISNRDNNRIDKSDLNGDLVAKWSVPDSPYGLSLTPGSNLLVTCPHRRRLVELWSESGECIRQVELQSYIKEPWHAMQLVSQLYVVSHSYNELSRVSVVDSGGPVLRTFIGLGLSDYDVNLLSCPCHVTRGIDDFTFVADNENNRVVLLSPRLELVRHIRLKQRPHRLYLDLVRRSLYVGYDSGDVTVLQV